DPRMRDDVAAIEDSSEGEVVRSTHGDRTLAPWADNAQRYPADPARGRPTFDEFDPDRDFHRIADSTLSTCGVYHTPAPPGKDPGLLREAPDYFFRTIDLVKQQVGDTVSVHGEVFSPFTHLMELFSYEDALTHLALDPEKAEAILDRLTEASIAWGLAQARHGVDAVLVSSAYAGG